MSLLHKGAGLAAKIVRQRLREIVAGLIILSVVLAANACSAPNNVPIAPRWIEPNVAGDTVSIPLSEVESSLNVHFKLLGTKDGNLEFMAYVLDGKIHVRSNACPPCHKGFTLNGDVLECDSCVSTFSAKTGKGIEGACMVFNKEPIPYEIRDDKIIMSYDDLIIANRMTLDTLR